MRIKAILAMVIVAGTSGVVLADGGASATPGAAQAAPAQSMPGATALTPDQIDGLTASIALLPDTLVTQILYAAMNPLDVVQAQRWLAEHPNATKAEIDAQPWHPSVRALAAYPSMISMMSDRLAWMRALGGAFVAQPKDVMQSIQRLRAQAQAVAAPPYTPSQTAAATQQAAASPAPQNQPVYQTVLAYQPAADYSFGSYSYGYPYGLVPFTVGPTVVIVGGSGGGTVVLPPGAIVSTQGSGISGAGGRRGAVAPFSTPVQSSFAIPRPVSVPTIPTRGR